LSEPFAEFKIEKKFLTSSTLHSVKFESFEVDSANFAFESLLNIQNKFLMRKIGTLQFDRSSPLSSLNNDSMDEPSQVKLSPDLKCQFLEYQTPSRSFSTVLMTEFKRCFFEVQKKKSDKKNAPMDLFLPSKSNIYLMEIPSESYF